MPTTSNLDGNDRVALSLIQVVSFDWNCPQYITPRFTEAEVAAHIAPLKARIAELEEQFRQRG